MTPLSPFVSVLLSLLARASLHCLDPDGLFCVPGPCASRRRFDACDAGRGAGRHGGPGGGGPGRQQARPLPRRRRGAARGRRPFLALLAGCRQPPWATGPPAGADSEPSSVKILIASGPSLPSTLVPPPAAAAPAVPFRHVPAGSGGCDQAARHQCAAALTRASAPSRVRVGPGRPESPPAAGCRPPPPALGVGGVPSLAAPPSPAYRTAQASFYCRISRRPCRPGLGF